MRFVKDPCGIACIIFTYVMVVYADYVVMRWIVIQTMQASLWGSVHVFLFNTIVFLLAMSHLKAVLSDPGTVPLPANRIDFSDMHTVGKDTNRVNSNSAEWTVCTRCETYRPPRAHHCRICKRCIRRMDHHCPWINNCVGERNQKFFLQFLVYVGVLSIYSISLVIASWLDPCEDCADNIESQSKLMHTLILLIEAALFGLFVMAIMVDQIHAILYDETAVEHAQHKGPHRPNRRKFYLLADVFGRGHPACWLLPCNNFGNASSTLRYYDEPLLSHEV